MDTKKNAIDGPINQFGIVNSPFRGGAAAVSIPNRRIILSRQVRGLGGMGGIIGP